MTVLVPELTAYFHPPAGSPARAILEAARVLPERSSGVISGALLTEDNEGTPDPAGPLSERVFGPRRDYHCACGKLSGPEHAGTRCSICRVECIPSSVRMERYGHIAAAGGLVHRGLGPVIAACLGWTEAQVWQVAFFRAYVEDGALEPLPPGGDPRMTQSGPEMLRRLLSEPAASARFPEELAAAGFAPKDLILDVIPVTPPATRPLHRMPGGALMPGLDSVRYQDLLAHNRQLRAMRERNLGGIQEVFAQAQHLALQTAFDALCIQLAAGPEAMREQPSLRPGMHFSLADRYWHREDRWEVELMPPPPSGSEGPELLGQVLRPTGCAFLGPDAVLLCFPFAALIVGLDDGSLRAAHPLAPVKLVSATAGYAVFTFDGELHALDLREGIWAVDAPGMPLAAVADRAGRSYLVDARRDVTASLEEVLGPLSRQAASPDGQLLWAEDRPGRGGVYSVDTGLRQVTRAGWRLDATPVSELELDGTMTPPPADAGEERLIQKHGRRTDSAFTLGADGRWRFLDFGLLIIDGVPVCRLAFQGSAAAFDTAGERLLIAGEDALTVVEAGPVPRVLKRFSLAPLHPLLSLQGLADEVRFELLRRFGSAFGLSRAAEEDWLDTPGLDSGGIEQLRALIDAARQPQKLG